MRLFSIVISVVDARGWTNTGALALGPRNIAGLSYSRPISVTDFNHFMSWKNPESSVASTSFVGVFIPNSVLCKLLSYAGSVKFIRT